MKVLEKIKTAFLMIMTCFLLGEIKGADETERNYYFKDEAGKWHKSEWYDYYGEEDDYCVRVPSEKHPLIQGKSLEEIQAAIAQEFDAREKYKKLYDAKKNLDQKSKNRNEENEHQNRDERKDYKFGWYGSLKEKYKENKQEKAEKRYQKEENKLSQQLQEAKDNYKRAKEKRYKVEGRSTYEEKKTESPPQHKEKVEKNNIHLSEEAFSEESQDFQKNAPNQTFHGEKQRYQQDTEEHYLRQKFYKQTDIQRRQQEAKNEAERLEREELEVQARNTEAKRKDFIRSTKHEVPKAYEFLGIEKGETFADIKKKYHILAKTMHPDRNESDPKAAEKFKALGHYYEVLQAHFREGVYKGF